MVKTKKIPFLLSGPQHLLVCVDFLWALQLPLTFQNVVHVLNSDLKKRLTLGNTYASFPNVLFISIIHLYLQMILQQIVANFCQNL